MEGGSGETSRSNKTRALAHFNGVVSYISAVSVSLPPIMHSRILLLPLHIEYNRKL